MPKTRHNDRRCVATGEALSPGALAIRFVCGPDGALVADLSEKLPGRGAWLSADRGALATALAKSAFGRTLKCEVSLGAYSPETFSDHVEWQLTDRMLRSLGLARKSGELIWGADSLVRKASKVTAYLFANDAAEDSIRKISARLANPPTADHLQLPVNAEQLADAVGSPGIVHLGALAGRSAANAVWDCKRLLSFLGVTGGNSP